MSDNEVKFPSEDRFARREVHESELEPYIQMLVADLLDIRSRTDPAGGKATSELKDIEVRYALQQVGRLVSALAGWAINHSLGRAAQGLGFTPLAPSPVQAMPEYRNQRLEADQHENEISGQQIFDSGGIPDNPSVERLALIDLFRANFCGLPESLAHRVAEALKALDFGDTHPLVEPKVTSLSKPAYARLLLELRALEHVEFRVGRGMRKYLAAEQVGEAYGVSSPTINSWAKHLRDHFGNVMVSSYLKMARNAGTTMTPAAKRNQHRIMIEQFDRVYGDNALLAAGDEYRSVRREGK